MTSVAGNIGGASGASGGPGRGPGRGPRKPLRSRLLRLGSSEEYSAEPAALVVVLVMAPVAFLGFAALAGAAVSPWLLLGVPLLALFVPKVDSVAPLVLCGVLGALWVIQVPAPFTWWSVPAAVTALVSHTALTLLAGAPTVLEWPIATVRRQVRRVALVSLLTLFMAGVAQLALRAQIAGRVAVVVAALAAVATWLWVGRWRDEADPGTDAEA